MWVFTEASLLSYNLSSIVAPIGEHRCEDLCKASISAHHIRPGDHPVSLGGVVMSSRVLRPRSDIEDMSRLSFMCIEIKIYSLAQTGGLDVQ